MHQIRYFLAVCETLNFIRDRRELQCHPAGADPRRAEAGGGDGRPAAAPRAQPHPSDRVCCPPPNRGHPSGDHLNGTYVPVEEPSTASEAVIGVQRLASMIFVGRLAAVAGSRSIFNSPIATVARFRAPTSPPWESPPGNSPAGAPRAGAPGEGNCRRGPAAPMSAILARRAWLLHRAERMLADAIQLLHGCRSAARCWARSWTTAVSYVSTGLFFARPHSGGPPQRNHRQI
jgi:hypothetical protein